MKLTGKTSIYDVLDGTETYIYDLQDGTETQSVITSVYDIWPHPA